MARPRVPTPADLWRARSASLRRVRVRRGARLSVERGGRVEVTGRLDLGAPWEGGRPYPSQLHVRRGGTLRVTGHVALHTDLRVWVNAGATLTLHGGYANYGLRLSCWDAIEIGRDCAIGEHVTIRDSDEHVLTGGSGPTAPIRIGEHVWIGSGATVLKGVEVGDGAVVAAGAVVSRSVPPRAVVAGVPARVIREDVGWT